MMDTSQDLHTSLAIGEMPQAGPKSVLDMAMGDEELLLWTNGVTSGDEHDIDMLQQDFLRPYNAQPLSVQPPRDIIEAQEGFQSYPHDSAFQPPWPDKAQKVLSHVPDQLHARSSISKSIVTGASLNGHVAQKFDYDSLTGVVKSYLTLLQTDEYRYVFWY